MAELKKCPFCGGEAETRKEMGGTTWRVKCTRCSAEVGRYWFGSRKQAVIAWNYRTTTEAEIRNRAVDEFAEKLKFELGQWIFTDSEKFAYPVKEQEQICHQNMTLKRAIKYVDYVAEQLKQS